MLERCSNRWCEARERRSETFLIDNVVENRGAQYTMTTANVIDTLCILLKREIPGLEEVIIVSDNAPNYVNLTLPLMSYYI